MSSEQYQRLIELRSRPELRNTRADCRLPVAALGNLAQEMRGALHTILGHAELLTLDATSQDTCDSAAYIRDSAERLRYVCDDVTDFLRLPELPDRGAVPLRVGALVESAAPIARARGYRVRPLESRAEPAAVEIDATAYRVVAHVVDHVVRTATADVTLSLSLRPMHDACVVTVAPAPECIDLDRDGVIGIASHLIAARGGRLTVVGWRLEMLVPVVRCAR